MVTSSAQSVRKTGTGTGKALEPSCRSMTDRNGVSCLEAVMDLETWRIYPLMGTGEKMFENVR